MFGTEHQIERTEPSEHLLSRSCARFISDLMFGTKHQIEAFLTEDPSCDAEGWVLWVLLCDHQCDQEMLVRKERQMR
jgi:hypothetical protein